MNVALSVVELVATVDEATLSVTVSPTATRVVEVDVGGVGPQGPIGPQGPQGDPGTAFVHTQSSASATWTINHNLGYRPAVTITDSGGVEVEGEVVHVSLNQVLVYFNVALAGQARCT